CVTYRISLTFQRADPHDWGYRRHYARGLQLSALLLKERDVWNEITIIATLYSRRRFTDISCPNSFRVRLGGSVVASGGNHRVAAGRRLGKSKRHAWDLQHQRRYSDSESPFFRGSRRQWPGVHHLPPTREFHERGNGDAPAAMAHDAGQRSSVRGGRRIELSRSAPGPDEFPFAASQPGPVSHRTSLAACRSGWNANQSGLSDCGSQRSNGLQHKFSFRPDESKTDYFGVSASARCRESAVPHNDQWHGPDGGWPGEQPSGSGRKRCAGSRRGARSPDHRSTRANCAVRNADIRGTELGRLWRIAERSKWPPIVGCEQSCGRYSGSGCGPGQRKRVF